MKKPWLAVQANQGFVSFYACVRQTLIGFTQASHQPLASITQVSRKRHAGFAPASARKAYSMTSLMTTVNILAAAERRVLPVGSMEKVPSEFFTPPMTPLLTAQ